ncbi:MAG: FAD-dependent oxidoreductase, partial [Betaproteobacteria bacterium]|nr:FAD-dependent oxidoreductase [Betaproteobacteria bacterium]
MKIAIIGSGIAGNVAAWHLHREHDITVFETGAHAGGHSHTHDVEQAGRRYAVDTGFIVFNDWTYPNFIALLDELGVASQPSAMSFSVRDEASGLEYNGTSLNTLFAQRANL